MDEPQQGVLRDLVVPGSMERRLGEFGVGVFWALVCLMNFLPPSAQAVAPWLFGPLSALASLHFFRRAFDRRPRLVVNSEGVTDRTALIGGSLFIPWSDILDVVVRKKGGIGLVVRDLAAVRRRAGVIGRMWMKLEEVLGVRTVPIMLTLLGVGKRELKNRLDARLLQFEREDLGLETAPRLRETGESCSSDE